MAKICLTLFMRASLMMSACYSVTSRSRRFRGEYTMLFCHAMPSAFAFSSAAAAFSFSPPPARRSPPPPAVLHAFMAIQEMLQKGESRRPALTRRSRRRCSPRHVPACVVPSSCRRRHNIICNKIRRYIREEGKDMIEWQQVRDEEKWFEVGV